MKKSREIRKDGFFLNGMIRRGIRIRNTDKKMIRENKRKGFRSRRRK